MIEHEIKYMLTAEQYEHILRLFSVKSTVVQTNYYYDTEDLDMNKRGITCRIREKNDSYVATVKQHLGGFESLEMSQVLQSLLDDSLFTGKKLKRWGNLTTERACVSEENEMIVFLDKNSYLGVIDYELEIEYPPGMIKCAKRVAKKLFQLTNVQVEGNEMVNSESKAQRFFKRVRVNKEGKD